MVSTCLSSTREQPITTLLTSLATTKVTSLSGGPCLCLSLSLPMSLTISPKLGMSCPVLVIFLCPKKHNLGHVKLNCRFIYLFIGIGVALFVISCCGCVGTCSRNICCLSCVSWLTMLLLDLFALVNLFNCAYYSLLYKPKVSTF